MQVKVFQTVIDQQSPVAAPDLLAGLGVKEIDHGSIESQ
jgi:hypothetical protein